MATDGTSGAVAWTKLFDPTIRHAQTMAEAMQALRPIKEKHIEGMRQRVEQEVAQLKKGRKRRNPKKPAPVSN
jgi:hypothetical protein